VCPAPKDQPPRRRVCAAGHGSKELLPSLKIFLAKLGKETRRRDCDAGQTKLNQKKHADPPLFVMEVTSQTHLETGSAIWSISCR
jgi:hypothetical protein